MDTLKARYAPEGSRLGNLIAPAGNYDIVHRQSLPNDPKSRRYEGLSYLVGNLAMMGIGKEATGLKDKAAASHMFFHEKIYQKAAGIVFAPMHLATALPRGMKEYGKSFVKYEGAKLSGVKTEVPLTRPSFRSAIGQSYKGALSPFSNRVTRKLATGFTRDGLNRVVDRGIERYRTVRNLRYENSRLSTSSERIVARILDLNIGKGVGRIKLDSISSSEEALRIGKGIKNEIKNIENNNPSTGKFINLVAEEALRLTNERGFGFKDKEGQLAFMSMVALFTAQRNLGLTPGIGKAMEGLAVGLEASGGKEDGYLSGMKIGLNITSKLDSKATPTLLHVEPDTQNLSQTLANPTIEKLSEKYNVFKIEEGKISAIGEEIAGKPSVYFLDNLQLKNLRLDGNSIISRKNIDMVIVNEPQVVFVDADLIRAFPNVSEDLIKAGHADVVANAGEEAKALELILNHVKAAAGERGLTAEGEGSFYKTAQGLSGERREAYELMPEVKAEIYKELSNNLDAKKLLDAVHYDSEYQKSMLDQAADMLIYKEKGWHYYVKIENGSMPDIPFAIEKEQFRKIPLGEIEELAQCWQLKKVPRQNK